MRSLQGRIARPHPLIPLLEVWMNLPPIESLLVFPSGRSSAAPRRCGKYRSLSVSCCWSPCDCAMSPRPRHAHTTRHNTMEAAATHERFVSSVITRGAPQPQSHSVRELQRAIARGRFAKTSVFHTFHHACTTRPAAVWQHARGCHGCSRGMVLCDLYQGRQLSSL